MCKEFTKIVYLNCKDCGRRTSVLCNESCQIIAVRCPDCLFDFKINMIEVEQLRNYLKKKNWIEFKCERDEVIRVESPKGYKIFIPISNSLIDYKDVIRLNLESIAGREGLSLDTLLDEILKEDGLL